MHLALRRLTRDPHIVVASLCANILGLVLPLTMIHVYDRIIPREGYETLLVLSAGLLTAAVADFGVRMARGTLIARTAQAFEADAYGRAFHAMLQNGSPLGALDHGTLHDRLASIERVRRHHGGEAVAAMLDIPFIVLFIAGMTLISPLLGAAVCMLAVVSVTIVWAQRRHIVKIAQARQLRDQRRHSFLVETIEGIEMIKGLGITGLMQRRYERLMAVNAQLTHDLNGLVNLTQGITAAVGLIAPVMMSAVGSLLVIQGNMSIGGVAASVLLTSRIVQPLLRMEALFADQRDTRQSEKDVTDLLTAAPPAIGKTKVHAITDIRMSDVSIAPNPQSPIVLRDINLTLHRGDCVLVNGADGAGRSLFMAVLAGVLDPVKGTMAANGLPYRQIDHQVIAERISLLSPEHTMLDGTLLENMTAFQVDRFRDTAFDLAQELGIAPFIARHSDGLSMRVAAHTASGLPQAIQDGVILISGLLHVPDVILFDEANAGLDRHLDQRLLGYLRRRRSDAIILMVTHRPSYQALANRSFTISGTGLHEGDAPSSTDVFAEATA